MTWRVWARARADSRCKGEVPGEEPQKTQTTGGLGDGSPLGVEAWSDIVMGGMRCDVEKS